MFKIVSLLIFVSLPLLPLFAQSECFNTFLSSGKTLEEAGDYDNAIIQYKAAQGCPRLKDQQQIELLKIIEAAQQKQITAVKAARKRAELAEQKALQLAAIAESRRLLEVVKDLCDEKNFGEALQVARIILEKSGHLKPDIWYNAFLHIYQHKQHSRLPFLKHTLSGHHDRITIVTFSPDGRHLLTASKDSTARLWNSDGELLTQWPGRGLPMEFAAFSPDGKYILTASKEGLLARYWDVWDLQGNSIANLDAERHFSSLAAFYPDGQSIVTASGIYINTWSTAGSHLKKWQGHKNPMTDLQMLPGKLGFLTADYKGWLRHWDLDGNLLREWQAHQSEINFVVVSAAGRQLLTTAQDSTTRLWDLDGNLRLELPPHARKLQTAAFSPDEQHLLTIADNGRAGIWDTTGRRLAQFTDDDVFPSLQSGAFMPDGQLVVTSSYSSVYLWDLSGNLLCHLPEHRQREFALALAPDGRSLAMAAHRDTVEIWQITPQFLGDPPAFIREAMAQAAASNDLKNIRQFDVAIDGMFNRSSYPREGRRSTASEINMQYSVIGYDDGIALVFKDAAQPVAELEGHAGKIVAVRISKFGPYTAIVSDNHTAKIWTLSGELVTTLSWPSGSQLYMEFTPDDRHLLMVFDDGTARLWNLDGKLIAAMPDHSGNRFDADFSPDMKMLAIMPRDSSAKIWSRSGRLLYDLNLKTGGCKNLKFSSDGKFAAVVTYDNRLLLLKADGKPLLQTGPSQQEIRLLAITPNDQYIALAAPDGYLEIIDLSGQPLTRISMKKEDKGRLIFSPDNQFFATIGNTIKIWDLQGLLLGDLGQLVPPSFGLNFEFLTGSAYFKATSVNGTQSVWPAPLAILSWLKQHQVAPVSQRIREKYEIY